MVAARSCDVEMASLLEHPFTLIQGSEIIAVVTAVNVIGESLPSDPNTATADIALVRVVPHKPPTIPKRDNALTTAMLLQVEIDELVSPETGGSTILSYHLRYDDGSQGETWTDLLGYPSDETILSHGVTASIQAGSTY